MTTVIDKSLNKLADEICRLHVQCVDYAQTTLEHARKAGELLIEAKSKLPHGEWLPWLKNSIEMPERTAQTYMRIARDWGELQANPLRAADLSLREAERLLADKTRKPDADEPAKEACYAVHEERTPSREVEVVVSPAPGPKYVTYTKTEDVPEISNEITDNIGTFEQRSQALEAANDAIDCLKKIPRNNFIRARAYEKVADWINHNMPKAKK